MESRVRIQSKKLRDSWCKFCQTREVCENGNPGKENENQNVLSEEELKLRILKIGRNYILGHRFSFSLSELVRLGQSAAAGGSRGWWQRVRGGSLTHALHSM
ncbi:hypothetical protein TIFTF001_039764 [Ficus carica]|uniref:Uncharacterized protein n=1 Tax=Ficus carica TaxID=3494 RepID=A0AA88CUY4_FICCA|nr:hypothetical protein TIFTF001_039764 [Ficus carica]